MKLLFLLGHSGYVLDISLVEKVEGKNHIRHFYDRNIKTCTLCRHLKCCFTDKNFHQPGTNFECGNKWKNIQQLFILMRILKTMELNKPQTLIL